jgi:hypothetical protein
MVVPEQPVAAYALAVALFLELHVAIMNPYPGHRKTTPVRLENGDEVALIIKWILPYLYKSLSYRQKSFDNTC